MICLDIIPFLIDGELYAYDVYARPWGGVLRYCSICLDIIPFLIDSILVS